MTAIAQVSLVALQALRLDQVWWLVSPRNPLKPNAPSADLARRVAAARALASPSAHPRHRHRGRAPHHLHRRHPAQLIPRLRRRPLRLDDGRRQPRRLSTAGAIGGRLQPMLPIAVFNRPGYALQGACPARPPRRSGAVRLAPNAMPAALPETPPPAWVFLPSRLIPLSSTALRQNGRNAGVLKASSSYAYAVGCRRCVGTMARAPAV